MSLTITLVRSGQTSHNLEKRVQTRTNVRMSNIGFIQSNILGEELCEEKFNRAYTSDLDRAKSTVERILRNNRHQVPAVIEDPRLRERDFGDWEGQPEEFVENESILTGVRVHRLTPPNGESYEYYAQKGMSFFKDLCSLLKDDGKSYNILVVTHAGWLLTFIDSIFRDHKTFQVQNLILDDSARQVPANTSVTRLVVEKSPADVTPPIYTLHFESYYDENHLKLSHKPQFHRL